MTSRLDRDKARDVLSWYRSESAEPAYDDEALARLEACVIPDRRISALSALCNTEAGLHGYLRTEDIRNILRGGS